MKKTIVMAAAIVALTSTFASAQMMMGQDSGKKMSQEQMNDMARAKPIPGHTFSSFMAPATPAPMMSHKKHHGKKMKHAM